MAISLLMAHVRLAVGVWRPPISHINFNFTYLLPPIVKMRSLSRVKWSAIIILVISSLLSLLLGTGLLSIPLTLLPSLAFLSIAYDKTIRINERWILALLLLVPAACYPLTFLGGLMASAAALVLVLSLAGGLSLWILRPSWLPLSGLIVSLVALSSFLAPFDGTNLYRISLTIVLAISLISGALYIKRVDPSSKIELPVDYLMEIGLIASFFAIELLAVYPGMVRMTTNDLLYHQNYAFRLVNYPSSYGEWSYLGYHSLLAGIYALSDSTPLYLMLSAPILNFAALIAVALSFSWLEERKEALFLWSFLTGFGWLALLKFGTDPEGIQGANLAAYKSIVWSQPIFFWALPLTLALSMLALLIYVDADERLPKGWTRSALVFVILTFTFLLHVVESLVFAAYLVLAAALFGGRRYQSVGAIFSGALVTALYLVPGVYRGTGSGSAPLLLLASIAALALNELRSGILAGVVEGLMSWLRSHDRMISYLSISILLGGLLVWLIHLGEVDVNSIYFLGQVPWFFYPVLLGVTSILAAAQLKSSFRREYALLVLVSLLMGRFITYYKLAGFPVTYWEYRFPFYAALGLAVLAAPLFRKMVNRSSKEWSAVLLIGLVFLTGYGTTVASVRAWNDVNTYNMGTIMQSDFRFAANSTFFRIHRTPLLTLTSYSHAVSTLLTPPSTLKQLVPWLSNGPEVPLYLLNHLLRGKDEAIAVLFTFPDLGFLERNNASFGYLRKFMGPLYHYPSLTVVNLSSPPTPNSSLAVVFPSDSYLRRRALVAYELVRSQLPPHTTYLSDDPFAPAGLYIGPRSAKVSIDEVLPTSPYDLRWLYIWGNFSEGLKVSGKRNVAVLSYELDEGSYELRACGMMSGYVGLYYDFHDLSNYRLFQVYLDQGVAINRIISEGKVSSSAPVRVPIRAPDRCVNITIRLEGGNLTALVNGKAIPVPPLEKLGVLGLETGDFSGDLTGRVRGSHSLRWNPPPGSQILDVEEGPMADLVDLGLSNITEARRVARTRLQDLGLRLPEAVRGTSPGPVAAVSDLNATGSVVIRGRPVWVEWNGTKVYVNASQVEVEVRAGGLRSRGGEGFYADFDLWKVESINPPLPLNMSGGRVTIRFRVPVELRIRGNATLLRYHRLTSKITRAPNVEVSSVNATVMMADNSLLFSSVQVPKTQVRMSQYRAFDETKFLPEALVIIAVILASLLYLDRRLWWEPRRLKPRRGKRGKGKDRR